MGVFSIIFIALFVINVIYLIDVSYLSKRLGPIGKGHNFSVGSPFVGMRAQLLFQIVLSPRHKALQSRPELQPQVVRIRFLLLLSLILFGLLMYFAFMA